MRDKNIIENKPKLFLQGVMFAYVQKKLYLRGHPTLEATVKKCSLWQ